MNGASALLDSNILIYLAKGTLDSDILFKRFNQQYISIISYMEVLGYQFKDQKDKKLIFSLISEFEIININQQIANEVIKIREKGKIKLPDAIILATAKINKLVLLTRNIEDFNNYPGIKIINPFNN